MAERLYIHETIMISVKHRKAYLDLMTDVWGPKSRELHNMFNFGAWATNGSTGVWPEAVVLWELESQAAFGRMLSGEYKHLDDPNAAIGDHYELFWGAAPRGVTDTQDVDRLLEPTAPSPSIGEALKAGVVGAGYYHQTIACRPGAVDELLAAYEAEWRPVAEAHGLRFVAAFKTLLRNQSEAIVLWALPAWTDWEKIGVIETDARASRFNKAVAGMGIDWHGKLLVPAARNPLNIGKLL